MTAPNPNAVATQQQAVTRPGTTPALGVETFLRSVAAIDTANEGRLTRFEMGVVLPRVFQYEIAGPRVDTGRQDEEGRAIWESSYSVGITADGYDHLNRWAGHQLVFPDTVPDESGKRVPNPIHRKDYLYLRGGVLYRGETGQLIYYQEDVEVDFMLLYRQARLEAVWYEDDPAAMAEYEERLRAWESAEDRKSRGRKPWKPKSIKHSAAEVLQLQRGSDGMPLLNEAGDPLFSLELPPEAELKALQRLHDLRAFGLRYGQTVLKNRLLKTSIGLRKLASPRASDVTVRIVGWKDDMTPDQRLHAAREAVEDLTGAPIKIGQGLGLSDDELARVEDVRESVDIGNLRGVGPDDDGDQDRDDEHESDA